MFGEKLKELRKQAKLTQKELADALGLSAAAIGLYEQNRRTPDLELIDEISDYFNVSVDYLLGKTNIRNFKENTIAFHRTDGYGHDLPEEAQKQLDDYIQFLYQKYGKK